MERPYAPETSSTRDMPPMWVSGKDLPYLPREARVLIAREFKERVQEQYEPVLREQTSIQEGIAERMEDLTYLHQTRQYPPELSPYRTAMKTLNQQLEAATSRIGELQRRNLSQAVIYNQLISGRGYE